MTLFFDANIGVSVARALRTVKVPDLSCITLVDYYRDTPTHGLEIPDETWMKDSSIEGWLVLTQDRNILKRKRELDGIVANQVGVVILQPGNAVNCDVLSFIVRRMDWLRRIDKEQRPFIYKTHVRGRPKRISLDVIADS